MNKKLQQSITTLSQHKETLEERFFVKKIAIFGSVARGTATTKSDIDVMVEFTQPVGFFTFLALEEYLEKILKRKVDAVTKNALKQITKKTILQEAVYV
jgi:predicted nucleotidyltransferase